MREESPSIDSLRKIKNFPMRLVEPLKRQFALFTSKVVNAQTSLDKSTTKLLVELQDGLRVETVIIRHGAITSRKPDGESRTTLCVSSQVGCIMGCKFCATGTMGILGDLCAGEILEQLLFARQFAEVRNIVFMGMGEPMNNYSAVVSAVTAMIDPHRFKLSPNRITVSTVGVPKPMRAFIQDLPQVNLALSLHAPTQALRTEIVPSARGFPIEKLIATADAYLEATGRTLLIEYVLLNGVNDTLPVARELGELLKGKKVTVNLIPYNSTDVSAAYRTPPREDILAFQGVLKEYKLATTIRKEMGPDIAAACGQLVVSKGKEETAANGGAAGDIEDMSAAGRGGGGGQVGRRRRGGGRSVETGRRRTTDPVEKALAAEAHVPEEEEAGGYQQPGQGGGKGGETGDRCPRLSGSEHSCVGRLHPFRAIVSLHERFGVSPGLRGRRCCEGIIGDGKEKRRFCLVCVIYMMYIYKVYI
jgi:sorting nexin-8